MVLYAATLILLVMGATLTYTRLSGRLLARQLNSQGQAVNAASAGLTESLAWFVHQRQQPVTAFDPKLDTGGVCTHVPPHSPLANETEQPTAGIIRTYEVMSTGRVFGRYEVRRTGVIDVSTRRGKPQAGTIWQLESNGIIYVRNDATQQPGVGRNTILARRTMRVEIQRLALQLPANAAISASNGYGINVVRPSRVQGGASGIGAAYPASTGTPRGNGTITGNPAQNTTSGAFTLQGVFGVTQQELLAMADIVVDDESQLPNPLPNMSLVVIRGNATFNSQRRLTGSGILVVLGNLIMNSQSDTFFNGVIWVGGTLNVSPPSSINGAIVANGNAQISGGSEVAEVNYDPAILDQIRQQMGNYLFSRSPWIVGTED
ncbi:MAG: hypothetical protein QOH21_1942 [Acidobacteriota bacterium]|nr:hypothetical protein [Acidobacteriota bacterium]